MITFMTRALGPRSAQKKSRALGNGVNKKKRRHVLIMFTILCADLVALLVSVWVTLLYLDERLYAIGC